jgi:hypothetical protein
VAFCQQCNAMQHIASSNIAGRRYTKLDIIYVPPRRSKKVVNQDSGDYIEIEALQ